MAKHISTIIQSAINKNQYSLRSDYVFKAIERNEHESIHQSFEDSSEVQSYQSSKESILAAYSRVKPKCWISGRKFINGINCYEVSIMFHSNLAYDLYIPIEAN